MPSYKLILQFDALDEAAATEFCEFLAEFLARVVRLSNRYHIENVNDWDPVVEEVEHASNSSG